MKIEIAAVIISSDSSIANNGLDFKTSIHTINIDADASTISEPSYRERLRGIVIPALPANLYKVEANVYMSLYKGSTSGPLIGTVSAQGSMYSRQMHSTEDDDGNQIHRDSSFIIDTVSRTDRNILIDQIVGLLVKGLSIEIESVEDDSTKKLSKFQKIMAVIKGDM